MATDRQLELALLVKAKVGQAKSELHDLQREIKQVGTSSEQAATGSKTQTVAINEQGKAARATTQALNAQAAGERKRFADLIHNYKAVEESERSIAERRTEAAGAAQTLTKAQREASAARARAAAIDRAAVQTQMADYAVLDKILTGNIKTRDELAAAEVVLDRLQKQGAIDTTELAAAFAALNKITDKNTAANVRNAASRRGLNSRAYAEIGTAASEVAAGNFGRLRRTGAAFLNQSGFFQKLFTPGGLAVTGLAAGVATLALAYKHATDEITDIDRELVRSGNVTGVTVGQIESLASSLDEVSHATAVQTLTALAASGRISADQLHKVGQAAIDLATLTNQSVADATAQIIDMMKAPAKGAKAFDEATHSLTAAQLQEITTLENTGHRAEAAAKLLDAVATSTKNGAKQIRESLPWYDKLFHNIGTNSSNFFSQVGNFLSGRNRYGFSAKDLKDPLNRKASLEAQAADQLTELKKAIANYKAAMANGGADRYDAAEVTGARAALESTYSQLEKLEKSSTFVAASRAAAAKRFAADVNQAGKEAENTLKSLGITTTKMMTYAQKLQLARQSIIDMFDAGMKLPTGVQLNTATYEPFGPGWEKIKKQLLGAQKYDAASRAAKAAARAQQQLANIISSLGERALGPVSAAWEKYAKAVRAADEAGAKAIKNGANVGDIQAQVAKAVDLANQARVKAVADLHRDLHIQLASATGDQLKVARLQMEKQYGELLDDLKRQGDTAGVDLVENVISARLAAIMRQAKQSFSALIGTIADSRVGAALSRIQKLNQALKSHLVSLTPEQKNKALTKIGQDSVQKAPQYQGVSPVVGGVYGDILRNQRAAQELEKWHNEQLAANEAFRAKDTTNEVAYQARLAEIDKQYSAQRQQIEQSRQQLTLQASSQFFGQLATLSSSHNKKMATIGKVAAIAQAVINTYQSATEAYASLASIPYVGPELGAAAAAAAIAAGLANVAQIRAQPIGGYAIGGYTGDAPVTQAVGLVHGREGVLSAPEVQALGGEAGFNALRRAIKYGYADGGYVNPLANAPSPADLGISAPAMPRMRLADFASAGSTAPPQVHVKTVIVQNSDQLAEEVLNTPTGTKLVIQHVGNNPNAIKGRWGS